MDRLIIALYRQLLGRAPSDTDIDVWLARAAQSGLDAKGVYAQIAGSAEAKAHAATKK